MPGGGAPVRDRNGKVIAHAPRTLIKDRTGGKLRIRSNRVDTIAIHQAYSLSPMIWGCSVPWEGIFSALGDVQYLGEES